MKDYFQNESTSRLDIFLNYFQRFIAKEREEWAKQDWSVSEKLINHIKSKKEELRNSAKGCMAKCPTCKKHCDNIHKLLAGTAEDPHSCNKGHQVRALAGNKLHNEEASVFCCEEMEPEDPVTLDAGQKPILWSEYIQQISNEEYASNCWNFNELLRKLANKEQNIPKFKVFWKLIGEEFCKRESSIGNNMIMCKESNKKKFTADGGAIHSHVILALDSSGSMQEHWKTLMESVKEFLEITKDKGTVSIIRVNDESSIIFDNEPISPVIATFIQFKSGLTDFNLPLLQGLDIMIKYQNSGIPFKFIFMTDGYADYPKKAIEKLVNSKIPFKFYSIAFGGLNPELTKITNELKGTSHLAMTGEILKEKYTEIGYEILKHSA